MKTLAQYKAAIKKATTKEELRDITYQAFLADEKALRGSNTLYNKVVNAAVIREIELGL